MYTGWSSGWYFTDCCWT